MECKWCGKYIRQEVKTDSNGNRWVVYHCICGYKKGTRN